MGAAIADFAAALEQIAVKLDTLDERAKTAIVYTSRERSLVGRLLLQAFDQGQLPNVFQNAVRRAVDLAERGTRPADLECRVYWTACSCVLPPGFKWHNDKFGGDIPAEHSGAVRAIAAAFTKTRGREKSPRTIKIEGLLREGLDIDSVCERTGETAVYVRQIRSRMSRKT